MLLFLRIVKKAFATNGLKILIGLIILYCLTYTGLYFTEGSNSDFADPLIFTYFFIVTITTVGYGDFSPKETPGGMIIGMFLIVIGFLLMTWFFAGIGGTIINFIEKKGRGLVKHNVSDHIIILEYHPGRTDSIVRELLIDGNKNRKIILCASDIKENPIKECLFVQGSITSEIVRRRANLEGASRIIVHGHDDKETLANVLIVNNANKNAHIIVLLADPYYEQSIEAIHRNPPIRCITSIQDLLAAQETLDPGITGMFKDLFSNGNENTPYRFDIPCFFGEISFGELFNIFKEKGYGMVIGTDDDHVAGGHRFNPGDDYPIKGGGSFFYIGKRRISKEKVMEAIQSI